MALDGNDLGDAIKAAVDAEAPIDTGGGETMDQYRTRIERARGSAIVTYLKANTVVHVSTSVVLSGPSACTAGGIVSTPPASIGTGTDNTGTVT